MVDWSSEVCVSYVNNLKIFVRIYELGNMSAAARDQRVSPAVASSRIAELENHLGVRLFNRTTRSLQATEQGRIFYEGANAVLSAIDLAEAQVAEHTQKPKGTLFVAAPLGVGRDFIAPAVPDFKAEYPQIEVRLRMTDRSIDITKEGLDIAFFLGEPRDSNHRIRRFAECDRILCAAPEYISKKGMPKTGQDLVEFEHDCLMLRYPGVREFQWTLGSPDGYKRFPVTGPFESDDGDVLTDWALSGHGIVNKPVFSVAKHLASGALIPVANEAPPNSVYLGCLYPHKKHQDPKVRLFLEFMATRCKQDLADRLSVLG
jgi:DNA-binding transcriptional LysR family regulator